MKQAVLAVNIGSSTLKFAVYPMHDHHVDASILNGNISGLEPNGKTEISGSMGDRHIEDDLLSPLHEDPFHVALEYLRQLLINNLCDTKILAVAHRVVHGGTEYSTGVIVNDEVIANLSTLEPLAPLHQPHNIEGIKVFSSFFQDIPQVACFDTSFHTTIPNVEKYFALPLEMAKEGIYRYGFHGLSYQYVSGRLAKKSSAARAKLLMAHLGNGSSLCASIGSKSVASSMGFSAVDGLMMGTRCGNIDPGVLLYLLENGWDASKIQTLIYKNSGLKGVSGISADMRTLRASESQDAKFAIDMYTHRVIKESGAMIACMEGLDAIAFTGGIGEHDAVLRNQVCLSMTYLGIILDPDANRQATGDAIVPIHDPRSRVQVWVVPTDEGRIAAEEAMRLLRL